MKKIAYLTSHYPAPSHTFIRREIAGVRARDVQVDTFSVRRPPQHERFTQGDREERDNTFYLVPRDRAALLNLIKAHGRALLAGPGAYFSTLALAMRHRVPGLKAFLWSFFYFAEAIVLAEQLRLRKIDHLHNHFANPAAIVGMLASRHIGMPWSLTLHGISEFDYPAGLLLREKLRHASFVACVCYFTMSQAMRVCDPRDWDKMFICHCGIETSSLPPAHEATDDNTTRMVCVGRLSPEKGHFGLLRAMATLRDEGIDASLTLVGDGPQSDEIEAMVARLNLKDRVTFTGQLDEAATLKQVREHDILVSASLMEGLPVVLMEAMALGVAAVAPRVAGIPELVRHGENGLLFAPADWDDLANQLREMVKNKDARARFAEKGKEAIHQAFLVEQGAQIMAGRFSA